ncbi:hypothetical protein CGLO_11998 [Colletotrichum gloeosporioides Cg-14]|uniref:Uncharacterized protein n=1 Tax=Colletotrichum gloeosporioides (strain Cg-14) TaxID=1237896 RepID=T0K707_COLGC|nr:hypothetical protein CGLO_11998 [Colletotrichum gloeosporioides Cg-14]
MHIYPTPISQPIGGLLGLAARQQDEEGVHVITQTIRRPATTFLTYVTLGPGDPTPVPGADIPETPVAATPTAEAPPPSRGSGSLSSAQIGAILGGIVGVVTILLIVYATTATTSSCFLPVEQKAPQKTSSNIDALSGLSSDTSPATVHSK